MGYTKLNIHIYSPTSYAHDVFFFSFTDPRETAKDKEFGACLYLEAWLIYQNVLQGMPPVSSTCY